jgi:hypothetical protein
MRRSVEKSDVDGIGKKYGRREGDKDSKGINERKEESRQVMKIRKK